jgi:hypothetical protein
MAIKAPAALVQIVHSSKDPKSTTYLGEFCNQAHFVIKHILSSAMLEVLE